MLSFSYDILRERKQSVFISVIIFFKNLLLFRSERSITIFRLKSLGLHRHYLRIS